MSQEDQYEYKPDCPYPAFSEVSVEDIERGTILTFETLLNYLYYVRTHELQLPNPLHPTLANACELIIKLLTQTFPLSRPLPTNEVYVLGEHSYIHSPLILNYNTPDFPGTALAQYSSVAYWHGGITGINEAHWKILAILTQHARLSTRGILIGFERDEYLATKGRETLRPWKLVVTVSVFAHIAQIYKIPLRLFIMPPIPKRVEEFDVHYMSIYRKVLMGNPLTPIVITLEDIHRQRKLDRMTTVGLQPQDWSWTDIELLIISLSTGLILEETENGYRSLIKDELDLITPHKDIPIPYSSLFNLWEDLSQAVQ